MGDEDDFSLDEDLGSSQNPEPSDVSRDSSNKSEIGGSRPRHRIKAPDRYGEWVDWLKMVRMFCQAA